MERHSRLIWMQIVKWRIWSRNTSCSARMYRECLAMLVRRNLWQKRTSMMRTRLRSASRKNKSLNSRSNMLVRRIGSMISMLKRLLISIKDRQRSILPRSQTMVLSNRRSSIKFSTRRTRTLGTSCAPQTAWQASRVTKRSVVSIRKQLNRQM